MEISDTPLESAVLGSQADVMLVLDNSGSMDWEFATPEEEGLFQGCLYLFPASAFQPRPDHQYPDGSALSLLQRRSWRSQWAGYNRIYFDPSRSYAPWPSTPRHGFDSADLSRPWSNPLRTHDGQARIDLTAVFFSIHYGSEVIRISNAHYFTHGDVNGNARRDPGEAIYLVTWVDEDKDHMLDTSGHANQDQRRYYRFADDGDDQVEDNELVPVVEAAEKNLIRPAVYNAMGRFVRFQTDREALQNFANWCTYYRRRYLALMGAAADIITQLKQVHVGICALNGSPRMGVRPVNLRTGDTFADDTPMLLDSLYGMRCGGRTPLRRTLDRVGRYFSRQGRTGFDAPFSPSEAGLACRRHMALVVSDGFWNGAFSGVGNADGDDGPPYADRHSNTFADVGAHYYNNDLAPGVADAVPAYKCSDAVHQHMVTMVLSFGLNGTLAFSDLDGNGIPDLPAYVDDPCLTYQPGGLLSWPRPQALPGHEAGGAPGGGSGALLDDLLHTAINGHGKHYTLKETSVLQRDVVAFTPQRLEVFESDTITLNSDWLRDTTILYRTAFDPNQWQGEVTAWGTGGGNHMTFDRLIWRASDQFQQTGLDWERRCVITGSGSDPTNPGVPFRYGKLDRDQQLALAKGFHHYENPEQMARDLVAYVRGAHFTHFRNRNCRLGDIVHSTPVVVDHTLFVGANDGMLHAFDARNGQERFAYVPSGVIGHLKALSNPGEGSHHRCYVDGPLWAGDVVVGPYQRRTYLVGALGKGGRGYFCLLAGERRRTLNQGEYGDSQWIFHVDQLTTPADEAAARQTVQWEYPRPDPTRDGMDNNANGLVDEPGEMDPQMGYGFGQGYAVNANSAEGDYCAVVIFGNGYNSPGQSAVLYVLTADSGRIVRKIDTGATGDNGLSTPALVDVNRDNRVDYAYAGDLHGNMWKFDLRATNPGFWGVAYGEDHNGDKVIDAASGDLPRPLFQAPGQPITGRPDIMAMATACNPQAPGYMVIFGTGRFLSVGDPRDTRQQSMYGIWDFGDDSDDREHLGYILNRDSGFLTSGFYLVRQTVRNHEEIDGVLSRRISHTPVDYLSVEDRTDPHQNADPDHNAGWFLDFPIPPDPIADAGERVTGPAVLRSGKVIVTSLVPEQTLCGSGGSSWIYLLDGCSGGQTETAAGTFPGAKKYAGRLFGRPVIVKDPTRPRLDRILVPGPGQAGGIVQEAIAGELWGRAYWWQNID